MDSVLRELNILKACVEGAISHCEDDEISSGLQFQMERVSQIVGEKLPKCKTDVKAGKVEVAQVE
jgi:hypothetical protein